MCPYLIACLLIYLFIYYSFFSFIFTGDAGEEMSSEIGPISPMLARFHQHLISGSLEQRASAAERLFNLSAEDEGAQLILSSPPGIRALVSSSYVPSMRLRAAACLYQASCKCSSHISLSATCTLSWHGSFLLGLWRHVCVQSECCCGKTSAKFSCLVGQGSRRAATSQSSLHLLLDFPAGLIFLPEASACQ